MAQQQYMTAERAAARLGVSRETLYAYVSRGLIRSKPAGDGSRRHQYAMADVEAHRLRREQQRSPAAVAENVLDWGVPVLESSITLIDYGRLYYRGQDAADLALNATLEEVAGLIWTGILDGSHFSRASIQTPHGWGRGGALGPIHRFQEVLLLAASADPMAYDLRPESVINSGTRIMHLLTQVLSNLPISAEGVTGTLQRGWAIQTDAHTLLNAALVLCADHELNVSAFTARCIASAGATPYAVIQGGLAALGGTRHGGNTERVEALLHEVEKPEDAATVLAARLRRGESLPGFGHPLYPDGDPRARLLLQLAKDCAPPSAARDLALGVAATVHELLDAEPTVDFALVTIAHALELPPGSALALFALGRTVGWIGHALEQYAAGTLIRPRARYVGHQPDFQLVERF